MDDKKVINGLVVIKDPIEDGWRLIRAELGKGNPELNIKDDKVGWSFDNANNIYKVPNWFCPLDIVNQVINTEKRHLKTWYRAVVNDIEYLKIPGILAKSIEVSSLEKKYDSDGNDISDISDSLIDEFCLKRPVS